MKKSTFGLFTKFAAITLAITTVSSVYAKPMNTRAFNNAMGAIQDNLTLRNYDAALAGAQDVMKKTDDAAQQFQVSFVPVKAAVLKGDMNKAREILQNLAASEKTTGAERVSLQVASAASYGVEGNQQKMTAAVDSIFKNATVSAAEQQDALWLAAGLFRDIGNNETSLYLMGRAEKLNAQIALPKSYTVEFRPDAPQSPGEWAHWDYANDPKHQERRWDSYNDIRALASDSNATRPLEMAAKKEGNGVDTFFAMAYNANAWYIYVYAQEPDIKKVMAEGGGAAGSLEMYFMPGTSGETYYHWAVNLATGNVNIYPWNSPHPGYRNIEMNKWSFDVQNVELKDGWGTLITIPWETVASELPLQKNEPWKMSIIRFTPHGSITWGGRVHETGRWGLVQWTPPTPEQETAIERHLIQRSWADFKSDTDINRFTPSTAEIWDSEIGDKKFYEKKMLPLIEEYEKSAANIDNLDKWDAATVHAIYSEYVPEWMNFKFTVEAMRKEYLMAQLMPEPQ